MASAYRNSSKKFFNEVGVTNLARDVSSAPFIRKAEHAILAALGRSGERVEVFLISGTRMRTLNLRFRGKNASTDTLSFPHPKEFVEAGRFKPLGEIYLNLSRIPSRKELVMILLHGTLHLLGFTHEKPRAREEMERAEKRILSRAYNLL